MGGSSSKGQVVSKGNKGKVLGPPSFPVQPPYNDTPVEYHFIETNATLDMKSHFSFMQPNVSFQSTSTDSYYPHLAAMYQQGYKMLVFVALPGETKSFGLASMGQAQITAKFQGIFRKMFPEEAGQQWELRVEKSMLINQMFMSWNANMLLNASSHSGSVGQGEHIFQTITNLAQNGGRLVSVEMTGMAGQEMQVQQQMMQQDPNFWQMYRQGQMPPMKIGVDVFYEVPLHPSTERYTYQVVSCPMNSTFQQSFPRGQFVSVIDWQGVMNMYMGSGWKLVEIFEDYSVSTMTKQQGFAVTMDMNKNCLWIFEKPLSRLNDNTPYYEGTMVEFQSETTTHLHGMGFGGASVNVSTNWEPVITDMGKYGWQVVRILETPDMNVTGTFSPKIYTRQMIFFQRKVAGRNEFTGQCAPMMSPPGPGQMGGTAAPMMSPPGPGQMGGTAAPMMSPPGPSQIGGTAAPVLPPSYNELYTEK